ncbi:putative 2-dehydropantoate 2-reductase [Synechococcus sp. PCC 7336]|uniref:putative 2-dehydropantoate 2-reductase n=1 Tax=Synechococcus sp. PCC 7336 TaxID=195250 RepID=UPI00034A4162|nr:putative 2-dehydropantoate 2-reductase [Synechococcus sp. PCC 7336]
MTAPLRYAIVGTGALGGYYGARLQQAGAEVHFLLHRDYDRVRQHGLTIESVDGDFVLPQVNAYCRASDIPVCDVALVCLKTTQNLLLPHLLPRLEADGSVLTLQNGMGIEAEIAAMVGDRVSVLGGTAHICSNKIGPGHIRHLDYGRIHLGAYGNHYEPQGITERMQAIAADFRRAGIETILSENLLSVRWHKLVWNIPFNGLSVVLDAKTDAMMADPDTRSLVEQLMHEVVAAAAGHGVAIAADFVQLMLDSTIAMKPYLTSMKLDFEGKRPLEMEAIYGNAVKAAREAGVSMPKTELLYRQLKFLDTRNLNRQPKNLYISR